MKYRYTIEMQDEQTGRWDRHPWTSITDDRRDANHGVKMLKVNEAPLRAMELFGPLRITRTPA